MSKSKYIKDDKILMNEWNYQKNIDINPELITTGMGVSVWWKCSKCRHEWRTRVSHRAKDGTGCPNCRKMEMKAKRKNELEQRLEIENLTITHPELIQDWDYKKNIDIAPESCLAGMGTTVWWKCSKCGYEWKTRINHRAKDNTKCPMCSKEEYYQRILLKNGAFADKHQELMKEWNYEKNVDINPLKIADGSNKIVWWKCSKCGNEWKASISNRLRGSGCKKCGQLQAKQTLLKNLIKERGSLIDNNRELAEEWNYEKNDSIMPNDVMLKSPQKVWWKCLKCGYEWKMSLYTRSKGGNCPRCLRIEQAIAQSKPINGVNDLLSQKPDLCIEWHPTKNHDLTPENVTVSSNKKVWWLGKCGHEWQATIGSRSAGRGCPKCLKEFKISFPEKVVYYFLAKAIDDCQVLENYKLDKSNAKEIDIYIPNLNLGLEYDGYNWHRDVHKDLEKDEICKQRNIFLIRIRENKCEKYDSIALKYYINDKKEDELENVIKEIILFINNKYNKRYKTNININENRTYIYELMEMTKKDNSISALYPGVAKEWNYEKNGSLRPEYISAHTHKKMWWKCPNGHEYQMIVKHKTEDNCKCPYCSSHRVLKGFNDLETIYPDIAKEWNYKENKDLKPCDVTAYSNRKVWWICPHGHEYSYTISHRTKDKRLCPICSMRKLDRGINDLKTINCDVAKEWNYEKNGEIVPADFTPISSKKVWWKCSKCRHEWIAKISNRFIKGNGCPKCAGEKRWETRKQKNILNIHN